MNKNNPLESHFLIATSQIKNSIFAGSLILVIEHSQEGANGIIVNRPLNTDFGHIFSEQIAQIHDDTQHHTIDNKPINQQQVYFGGPVASDRGFILHAPEHGNWQSTVMLNSDIALTSSNDIIIDLIRDKGPKKMLIALGYAGWKAQQLEHEMLANDWIAIPANGEILFDTPFCERLQQASKPLGIDPNLLTPQPGHA